MFAARNGLLAGRSKVVLKGSDKSNTSSVTIPTHAVGDLIVAWAAGNGGGAPAAPSASGTVPTWNTIHSVTNFNRQIVAGYAVAAATNTTSGTWTNTAYMLVAVFSGQNSVTPIGGDAASFNGSVTTVTAPSITLSNTDGTSQILHGFFTISNPTWGSTASGYTVIEDNTTYYSRLISKDETSTDGSVSYTNTTARVFSTSSIEIKA